MGITPIEMSSIQLELSNNSEISIFNVMLNEIHMSTIDKANSHCRSYKNSDFNACSRYFFSTQLKDKINCTLPGKPIMFFPLLREIFEFYSC